VRFKSYAQLNVSQPLTSILDGIIIKTDTKYMENPIQKKRRAERDKEIMNLYPNLTMEEIGKRYGLTRRRISQIIKKQRSAKIKNN